MNFSIIARFAPALTPFAVAAVVVSLAACSSDGSVTPETDSGPQADGATDTGTQIKDSGTAQDTGTTDSGTPDSGTADSGTKDAGPAATWTAVHTEFVANCTPCHSTGGSGGHNMAQASIPKAYADSQLASGVCAGLTKGACAGVRIRNGSMPLSKTLSAAEKTRIADIVDSWVGGGQKGP